jgi:MFS family permease
MLPPLQGVLLGSRLLWLGVAGALLLSRIDLGTGLVVLLVAAFLFNLVAACQDIATDGLAVRILDQRERGLANGIQVGAYRIGMILGGIIPVIRSATFSGSDLIRLTSQHSAM